MCNLRQRSCCWLFCSFLSQAFEDRDFRKFEISWAIFSARCVLTCPVESKPNRRMIKMKTIEIVLMVCSPAENRGGENAAQNTEQRTRDCEPEGNVPA